MALVPLAKIKQLCDRQQWHKALPAIQARARMSPKEVVTLNVWALCLFKTGQLDAAQAACERSLALDATQGPLWTQAATIALQRDNIRQALAYIAHADRLTPKAFNTQLIRTQVLIKAHRWQDVPDLMTQLLAREPNHPQVRQLQLQCFLQEERFAEAEPLAASLCEASPTPDHLNSYGIVLMNLGRCDEAVALFRRGVSYCLNNPPRESDAVPPRPYMDVGLAREALLALHTTMGQLKVPFFLAFGTLLGIVRDGELLPHDKDMDVGLPWQTPRLPLVEALLSHGYVCPQLESYRRAPPDWYLTVVHQHTGITIDFFFAKPVDNKVEMGFSKGSERMSWAFAPFKLTAVDYAGQSFKAPSNAMSHLEEVYGTQWDIPDANFDSCLVAPNLGSHSRRLSQAMGLNRLLGLLVKKNWKKAHGYCLQMQSVVSDPLIDQLRTHLEARYNEAWFPERSYEATT